MSTFEQHNLAGILRLRAQPTRKEHLLPARLGRIGSKHGKSFMKPSPEDIRKKWVSMEQIVEAALFLLSPASDGITGAIVPVQGMGI